MTIFIEPSTSNRPRTRSQKDSSFLGVVAAEMNPEALTKKGRRSKKDTDKEIQEIITEEMVRRRGC